MKLKHKKGNKVYTKIESAHISKKGRAYKRRKWQEIKQEIALES